MSLKTTLTTNVAYYNFNGTQNQFKLTFFKRTVRSILSAITHCQCVHDDCVIFPCVLLQTFAKSFDRILGAVFCLIDYVANLHV